LLVMAGRATTCALAAVMLTACGGGGGSGGSGTTPSATTYTIGGTISGLAASGLTLDDNGGNTLTVASGATTFTFSTALASGTAYAVTVASQPTGETCTVSSGTGTATANVTSVAISCAATYTIGGTVTDLTELGLTLDNNGGNTLTVASGATTFTFATAVTSGAAYDVTVATQPLGESCTATANTGTASANVTSVAVACADSGVAVGTFAGSPPGAGGAAGTAGNANGTGTAATFSAPAGVAVDSAGNVYVAEYSNNDIRKITPNGVVTLFAGSSTATQGDANGTGNAASFWNPTGVAVDSTGNVYVADESNNQIRKITPDGAVTVFAGSPSGAIGSSDGIGTAASFSAPNGIAIDSSGNLWVTDSANNEIREITTPGASVSTPYGNGTAGKNNADGNSATFNTPTAIAVDPSSGNLFVADTKNNEIREINVSTTAVTLFAGSTGGTGGSGNGTGSGASFSAPSGIAIDAAGNLYVADTGNSEIRMVTPAGVVSTYAGSTSAEYVNGSSSAARFNYPFGIAIYSGTLYVGDDVNNAIRVIAP
ncbi:MAG: SMP-30/gluconolactonase/LRE family protein, partial [Steroidobacteraceae bacterium]